MMIIAGRGSEGVTAEFDRNVEMLGPQDGRPIRISPSQCGIAQFEPVHDDLGHCRVKINNISGASPAAIGVSECRCAEESTPSSAARPHLCTHF